MIAPEFIDQLLSRVDIVDVVDRYVPLKKAGQNYLACCPFHKEKTPSFTVSPSKQFYHCFGCGAHGSAIGFVMEYQGLSFVDAVQMLAAGVGVQVPQSQQIDPQRAQQQRQRRASLEQLMLQAAQFYKDRLKRSSQAIGYLKQRGLTGQVAAQFGLGYAPEDRQALAAAVENYNDDRMVESGLVIAADEQSSRRDRFRGRIMFPIRNQRGTIIGFGARIIGKGEPKYLNSPETPLFEKGHELYGLYEARQEIRSRNCVLVVEGYMDVVALAQHGINFAVAALGTATTAEHIKKLLRHADDVYFCFDGDNAGQKAAWRALENSLSMLQDGKALHFLFLPAEHDPDSFVREFGAEAFEHKLFNESMALSAYFVQELTRRSVMETPEGRADMMRQATPLLAQISAPALGFLIRQRLAELAGVSLDDFERLTGQTNQVAKGGRRDFRLPKTSHRPACVPLVRKQIIWLINNPVWAEDVVLPDSLPLSDELACLAVLAETAQQQDTVPSSAQLLESVRGTPYETLVYDILHQVVVDPDEFDHPGDEARLSFRQGNEKLLTMLRAEQLENLIEKSQHEALSDSEKHLLLQLLSSK